MIEALSRISFNSVYINRIPLLSMAFECATQLYIRSKPEELPYGPELMRPPAQIYPNARQLQIEFGAIVG